MTWRRHSRRRPTATRRRRTTRSTDLSDPLVSSGAEGGAQRRNGLTRRARSAVPRELYERALRTPHAAHAAASGQRVGARGGTKIACARCLLGTSGVCRGYALSSLRSAAAAWGTPMRVPSPPARRLRSSINSASILRSLRGAARISTSSLHIPHTCVANINERLSAERSRQRSEPTRVPSGECLRGRGHYTSCRYSCMHHARGAAFSGGRAHRVPAIRPRWRV